MMGVTVLIKLDGKQVQSTVLDGSWSPCVYKLHRALSYIRLTTGHHGDRDMELAELAVHYFGGTLIDNRPKPKDEHKLPR